MVGALQEHIFSAILQQVLKRTLPQTDRVRMSFFFGICALFQKW